MSRTPSTAGWPPIGRNCRSRRTWRCSVPLRPHRVLPAQPGLVDAVGAACRGSADVTVVLRVGVEGILLRREIGTRDVLRQGCRAVALVPREGVLRRVLLVRSPGVIRAPIVVAVVGAVS